MEGKRQKGNEWMKKEKKKKIKRRNMGEEQKKYNIKNLIKEDG